MQKQQNSSGNAISEIKIKNTTDVDEFTKIVNMTYSYLERAGTILQFDDYTYNVKSTTVYVLSQDRNTEYRIVNNLGIPNINNQTQHPPAVQEVFNSFELVGGAEQEPTF